MTSTVKPHPHAVALISLELSSTNPTSRILLPVANTGMHRPL
jgi:hypothetical protein